MTAQEQGETLLRPRGHVQAFGRRQVIGGMPADLADHQGTGRQAFLEGPEPVLRLIRLDQEKPVGRQAPLFETQRVGASEILVAPGRGTDPENGPRSL